MDLVHVFFNYNLLKFCKLIQLCAVGKSVGFKNLNLTQKIKGKRVFSFGRKSFYRSVII